MNAQKFEIKTLIEAVEIAETIDRMAQQIKSELGDQEVILVGVLDGGFAVLYDLSRALHRLGMDKIVIDFIGIDTYGHGTTSSKEPKITKDLKRDIRGKIVLIVEDIVDTGFSLSVLQALLLSRRPARLMTAALLSKSARREIKVPVDYIGREIEDEFVIGYGLDFDGRYRELPYIGVVKFS